jgi:membrane protease YdiL (CAAX protease family)
MPDPALVKIALAIVLVAVVPLTAPLERRFHRSNPNTARKLLFYGLTMLLAWGLTAVAVWTYGWDGLIDADAPVRAWLPAPAVPVLAAPVVVYFAIALMPLAQSLRGLRWRRAYAGALRRHGADLAGLLPNTAVERFAFVPFALTAGICEEALYRGFMIRFLHEGPLALPIVGALAASTLAFGLGHLYQGWKGVLRTSIAGLGLGLMFLLSGNLILAMIVHALVDMQVAYVLRPIPGDEAPAAAQAA